jgi:hypothetical protein
MKRNGPLPVKSLIWVKASVAATRAGITYMLVSANGSRANGFFRRNTMVRSSAADISSVAASRVWPMLLRWPQRRMEAMQSAARTGSPSWNHRPSRRVRRQPRPSSDTTWPATICGCGSRPSSRPYSVSQIILPWMTATVAVVQTGSGLARSACGT